MHTDSETTDISPLGFMHYMIAVSLEMSDEPQISLQQLLEHGDFPFADELLQSIKSQQEEMQQGADGGGLPPELLQQAQEGADMEAVNKAYGMLRG